MICSGCTKFTELDYDDSGIGILCKDCRDEWDKNCQREVKILRDTDIERPKKVRIPHRVRHSNLFTKEVDCLELLREYRAGLGLDTVIGEEEDEITREYMETKRYKQQYSGAEWLKNIFVTNREWDKHVIGFRWIPYESRSFDTFPDLIEMETTLRLIESPNLKVAVSQNEVGVLALLTQTI